jgi:acetyltransferase
VKLEQLVEVLMRFSYMIAECPEIGECDVNPLLVSPREVVALDARIILDRTVCERPTAPYSHLAIRPYPAEFITRTQLRDGSCVTVRPIRPEDEPRWHQMLAACSAESLHSRFQQLIKTDTHAMASRYCFIDYDREMALVVQNEASGEFAAIGRLVADPDHATAEFAILVADPWQGIGLGTLLTQRCIDVARAWGIQRLSVYTTPGNARMLAILGKLNFAIDCDYRYGSATGTIELGPSG